MEKRTGGKTSGHRVISAPEDLAEAMAALKKSEAIGADIEGTGLSPRDDRMRLLQLSTGGETFIFDVFETDISPLKEVLEDGPVKVFQNAKFDLSFLFEQHNIRVAPVFDTMLAAQLLSGGDHSASYSLDAITERYLDIEVDKSEQTADWSGELSESQLEYAAKDAEILLPLHDELKKRLEEEKLSLVSRIEFEAVAPLAEMELAGIKLDVEKWKELEKVVRVRRDEAAERLEAHFPQPEGILPLEGLGPRLNLNSPKQITGAFKSLGVDLPDTKVWTLLKVDHPAAKDLLAYRELQKKLGTYLETYPKFIHPNTGRIHPNFLQCRVPTGRLACTNPNVQQIPHEDEFRSCFVAEENNILVIADYSQIELRILAEVSEDPEFVRAFNEGEDLHRLTASTMFGVPLGDVTKDQRTDAKRINFGLMYGRGAKSLSAQLGEDEDHAKKLIDEYFANYPKVQEFLNETADRAIKDGALRTLADRVRKFRATSGLSNQERGSLRREAMNYPIQGTASDIAKLALIYIHKELLDLDARLINSIHDECVIECTIEEAEKVATLVQRAMVKAGRKLLKSVPVEVEVRISREWAK